MVDNTYVDQSAVSSTQSVMKAQALSTKRVDSERRKSIEQILDTLNRTTITESELGSLYKHKRTRRRSSASSHSPSSQQGHQKRRTSLPSALVPLPIRPSLQNTEKEQDKESIGHSSLDGSPLSSRILLDPVNPPHEREQEEQVCRDVP
jgi:hypothetical protein